MHKTITLLFALSISLMSFSANGQMKIYYEHNLNESALYESFGLEFLSDHPEQFSYSIYGGLTTNRSPDMYPDQTYDVNTYLYAGISGQGFLSPFVEYAVDMQGVTNFLDWAFFDCTFGCTNAPSSRFLTTGLKFKGSTFEIDVYRRWYLLRSVSTSQDLWVTGIRYGLKF